MRVQKKVDRLQREIAHVAEAEPVQIGLVGRSQFGGQINGFVIFDFDNLEAFRQTRIEKVIQNVFLEVQRRIFQNKRVGAQKAVDFVDQETKKVCQLPPPWRVTQLLGVHRPALVDEGSQSNRLGQEVPEQFRIPERAGAGNVEGVDLAFGGLEEVGEFESLLGKAHEAKSDLIEAGFDDSRFVARASQSKGEELGVGDCKAVLRVLRLVAKSVSNQPEFACSVEITGNLFVELLPKSFKS